MERVIKATEPARSSWGGRKSLARLPLADRNNDPVQGWHREERRRISQPDKIDVYYHAPDGRSTLRSGPDVTRFIERAMAEGGQAAQLARGLNEGLFTFSRAARLRKEALLTGR